MAKFYVQCGSRNLVVDAVDASAAAMHLVDLAMQPHLWIYDDAGLSDDDRHDHLMVEALLHLAPEIRLSQRGLDRNDAVAIGTPETVQAWHRTMTAVARLMTAAGLSPRPVKQLAVVAEPMPKRSPHANRGPVLLPLRPIRRAK